MCRADVGGYEVLLLRGTATARGHGDGGFAVVIRDDRGPVPQRTVCRRRCAVLRHAWVSGAAVVDRWRR